MSSRPKDTRYRPSRLVFEEPVDEYGYPLDRLPLGNGRVGCMFTGGPVREAMLLNHALLRRARGYDGSGSAAEGLEEVRRRGLAGDWQAAQELFDEMKRRTGCSRSLNPFHPAGFLILTQRLPEAAAEYRCVLDLHVPEGRVSFTCGEVRYERRYAVDEDTDAVTVELSSSLKGSIDVEVALARAPAPECRLQASATEGQLRLCGRYEEGLQFEVRCRITHRHGATEVLRGAYDGPGEGREDLPGELAAARIRGADRVELVIEMAVSGDREGPRWRPRRTRTPHRALFEGVRLRLGDEEDAGEGEQPVDLLLREARRGRPPACLFELVFQMARYLLMSASRAGGPPAHLQGIWSYEYSPAWQCRYQLDVNLQACYWLAHPAGLEECCDPYFDLVEALVPAAEAFARDLYGCEGMVLGVGTDGRNVRYASNLESQSIAGWVAGLFWEHWEFTGDREFLRSRAYPLLRSIGRFFEEFLFRGPGGRLCLLPSNSPENQPANRTVRLSRDSTIDIAVAREVVQRLLESSEVLEVDEEAREKWRTMLEGLPPWPVMEGMLAEWADESAKANDEHRHLSHLYPLFPGCAFTPETTPELVDAAVAALQAREAGFREDACSFSYIWPALLYARAGRAEEAYDRLCRYARGFLMPNLLSSLGDRLHLGLGRRRRLGLSGHLFQIESGIAAGAVIAEMLVQSHAGVLRLLPALPAAWQSGGVEGLRARGGLTVSLEWRRGVLERAEIRSSAAAPVEVRIYGGDPRSFALSNDRGTNIVAPEGGAMELAEGVNVLEPEERT